MIRFQMYKASIEQFAIVSDMAVKQTEVVVATSTSFKYADAGRLIACVMRFEFKLAGQTLMILQLCCEFVVNGADLEQFKSGQTLEIPKSLLEFFASQVVGTARGVIVCKTEGTKLSNIVLPTMDITKLFSKGISIPLE